VTDETRRLNERRFTETAGRYAASGMTQGHVDALLRVVAPERGDRLLDVACGPGGVLNAFAPWVHQAVGIDLTMAMLSQARLRLAEGVVWLVCGDAERLPFPDAVFTLVVTTWAMHHFANPGRVLEEAARVCRRGGRVAVADLVGSDDEAKRARQNAVERLRDPSHVEAMSRGGLAALFLSVGLMPTGRAEGSIERDVDEWCRLAATPEDVHRTVREMLVETAAGDAAGMGVVVDGPQVKFSHTWMVIAARK
jgi:SAM-dependent methyltransferase